MPDETELEQLAADMRSRAGHYEILGETYAKFEFFEKGWNPYSRFLDVDKVDLILRRRSATGQRIYREIQVKFGKLYPVGPAWERELFDFTSWRFFKEQELCRAPRSEGFLHRIRPLPRPRSRQTCLPRRHLHLSRAQGACRIVRGLGGVRTRPLR